MTDEESNKHFIIDISSSDESKSPPSGSDDDAVEEISSSTSCNDDVWSEWSLSEDEDKVEVGGDEDWDIDDVDKPDTESMCNKVIQFIRGRSDLQELKVDECKAYLRRHNLRLSGTREECMERIKEHWKLKDGNGEVFYPRSSFIVDCTGDVCKGDIVLFHQNVHQKSGITARNKTVGRKNVGRRTVAGRIIKESYGATRQQHTFTVEVLWTRGTKKLEPLFPLLVKGRNLYKLKTFRQLWKNEEERLEVLAEKHRRGTAARTVRAMRRAKLVMRKNEPSPSAFKGPSRTRETSPGRKTYPNEHGKLAKNNKRIHSHRFAPYSSKQNAGSRGSAPYRRGHNSPNHVRQSPSVSLNYPVHTFNHFKPAVFPTEPLNVYSHGRVASIDGSPYPYPHPLPHSSKWTENSHGSSGDPSYSHSKNENEAVSFNYPGSRSSHHPLYSTYERHKRR